MDDLINLMYFSEIDGGIVGIIKINNRDCINYLMMAMVMVLLLDLQQVGGVLLTRNQSKDNRQNALRMESMEVVISVNPIPSTTIRLTLVEK